MNVSLLVPYRPDGGARDRLWSFLRARYEARFPSWEIVTAPGPAGEFSRAGAICDAADKAAGSVFVVADADVWCEGIEDAVARVEAGATWADPAELTVLRMSRPATEALLAGGEFSKDGAPKPLRRVSCGGVVAISREAFFRCPPDRRFVGWGVEDHAWEAELMRLLGRASVGPRATLWHLWHPPVAKREASAANRQLLREHVLGKARLTAATVSRKIPPARLPVARPSAPRPEPSPVPAPASSAARRRILILADVPTWAWAKKAAALKACLSDRFDIEIVFSTHPGASKVIAARRYDLLHTFEVFQSSHLPPNIPHVTGITAHVWRTWESRHGVGTVKRWASRSVGFHANSKLLQAEIQDYLGRSVYYVPNGVDEQFYRRSRPRDGGKLVVGHVGKDNPRKGFDLIAAACKKVGVELRDVRRRSSTALTADEMLDFYQGVHVLAVASDMDGTPNPALEAAACECAVLSNHIGNMPEFVEDGVNGLFHDRTVDGIAEALQSLVARPLDEVEEMGRAARRTVAASWTWRDMAENYAAMWAACIG